MTSEILLEIENFGPIKRADLEIGKINVIIGKNSSGKSTSSKLLYCLLTATTKEGNTLANSNISSKLMNFIDYWAFKFPKNVEAQLKELKNTLTNLTPSQDLFEEVYLKLTLILENQTFKDREMCIDDLNNIKHIININKSETKRFSTVFNALMKSEYGCSPDRFENSKIRFHATYGEITQEIRINDKNLNISKEFLNYFTYDNIIYIDSPSILETNKPYHQYHMQVLERKLKKIRNAEDIYDEEYYRYLSEFKENINNIIKGKFKYIPSQDIFVFTDENDTHTMQNTASGLKQLGVIQLLVENNELTKNSFLILDEPECNLHPDFQVEFARILVLASKELNITLYINTHSPFFAEAIEAYARYYEFIDNTNFYLSEKNEDKYDFYLMNGDDLLDVYDRLGDPFETIHRIKVEADIKQDFIKA